MPRFSTKTLLFVFALVALWCSTFSGYSAGRDVQASVLLIIFLTAGFLAVYNRGKGRAFWAGFFAVMLLCGGNIFEGPVNKFIPNFHWLTQSNYYGSAITLQYAPAPQIAFSTPQAAPVTKSVAQFMAAPPPALPPTATIVPVNLRDQNFSLAVHATIVAAWMFALAVIVGLIAVWLYGTTSRAFREQSQ